MRANRTADVWLRMEALHADKGDPESAAARRDAMETEVAAWFRATTHIDTMITRFVEDNADLFYNQPMTLESFTRPRNGDSCLFLPEVDNMCAMGFFTRNEWDVRPKGPLRLDIKRAVWCTSSNLCVKILDGYVNDAVKAGRHMLVPYVRVNESVVMRSFSGVLLVGGGAVVYVGELCGAVSTKGTAQVMVGVLIGRAHGDVTVGLHWYDADERLPVLQPCTHVVTRTAEELADETLPLRVDVGRDDRKRQPRREPDYIDIHADEICVVRRHKRPRT